MNGYKWLRERLEWAEKDKGLYDYNGLGELLNNYRKEILISENRLWIEQVISQNSGAEIKPLSENDFVKKIETLKKEK